MKFISRKGYRPAVLIGVILMCCAVAPPRARGAEAHATASAELIDPAQIDTSKLLGDAAAEAAAPPPEPAAVHHVEPEVKLSVEAGVTSLRIDYN